MTGDVRSEGVGGGRRDYARRLLVTLTRDHHRALRRVVQTYEVKVQHRYQCLHTAAVTRRNYLK